MPEADLRPAQAGTPLCKGEMVESHEVAIYISDGQSPSNYESKIKTSPGGAKSKLVILYTLIC